MKNRAGGHRGFAVLTVIFFMIVFAILGVASVSLITTSSQMVTDEQLSEQALHIADAGIAHCTKLLSTDGDWSNNAGYTKSFGGGSFTISYVAQALSAATIRSDGTVGGISRSVQQELSKADGLADAWQNAFYSEEEISAGGSASGTVDGNVNSGGGFTNSSDVVFSGETTQNNTESEIPQPDWAYWLSHATTVINDNYTFSSGTYSGIYYITGNVSFGSDVTVNGTIVTLGSVDLSGHDHVVITAVQPNPAIIAQGAILMTGTSDVTITGFVFTMSTITMTGTSNVGVSGGMIAGGDITMTGTTDVDIDYVPVSGGSVPGFSGGAGAAIITEGIWKEVS